MTRSDSEGQRRTGKQDHRVEDPELPVPRRLDH
jgi:hypothetical protein